MSYHLCIKLCTCLTVHRIEVKKHIANTLYYIVSRKKKNYCAQEKRKKKQGERNMFICDDILIKALWLDEESHEFRVF